MSRYNRVRFLSVNSPKIRIIFQKQILGGERSIETIYQTKLEEFEFQFEISSLHTFVNFSWKRRKEREEKEKERERDTIRIRREWKRSRTRQIRVHKYAKAARPIARPFRALNDVAEPHHPFEARVIYIPPCTWLPVDAISFPIYSIRQRQTTKRSTPSKVCK